MASERVERRLAAVLAADVAGYSRLMGADEEGTLAALKTLRNSLIDPKLAEHRGRIVKTTGDGVARGIRQHCRRRSLRDRHPARDARARPMPMRPSDEEIEFRIGINVGDIIVDGDDIFGDVGVNVAARLESIAPAGGVCVSDVVHQQVNGRVGLHSPISASKISRTSRGRCTPIPSRS